MVFVGLVTYIIPKNRDFFYPKQQIHIDFSRCTAFPCGGKVKLLNYFYGVCSDLQNRIDIFAIYLLDAGFLLEPFYGVDPDSQHFGYSEFRFDSFGCTVRRHGIS